MDLQSLTQSVSAPSETGPANSLTIDDSNQNFALSADCGVGVDKIAALAWLIARLPDVCDKHLLALTPSDAHE